jgi:hypothetical protein
MRMFTASYGITSITIFNQNPSSGSRIETCGPTERHNQPLMLSFYERKTEVPVTQLLTH